MIATHHLDGHRIDVVESVDDDNVTIGLLIDGELLSPDVQMDREPTAEEAASVLEAWRQRRVVGEPQQVANSGGLRAVEVIALLEALDGEHKAQATASQVLADFGDVLPFANIIEAEDRHIDALTRLMHRYGVPVPSNPWTGKVPRFESVGAACVAAVQAEVDNGAMFDRLMATTDRSDILEVFHNLEEASRQRHLPAFQRCAERGGPDGGRERGGPGGGGGGGGGGGQHRHGGGA